MTNNFTPKKSGTAARPQLSPEEYAAKKKAEKDAVYQMIDNTATEIVSAPDKFRAYLDTRHLADCVARTSHCAVCEGRLSGDRPKHPSNHRRSNRFLRLHSCSLIASPKPYHGKCLKAALFYGICHPASIPAAHTFLLCSLLLLYCFFPLLFLFRMNRHTNHDCIFGT